MEQREDARLAGEERGEGRGRLEWPGLRRLRLPRARWRADAAAAWLRHTIDAELAERAGFQWLAVAFGCGALVYFALPREPFLPALVAVTVLCAAGARLLYARGSAWRPASVAALALAGVTIAGVRVATLDGPHVERAFSTALSGRVVAREARSERRPRITLDELRFDEPPRNVMPQRLRISLSPRAELPPLGSRVALRARLMPVPGPTVPGGYDARRAAFFAGLGGSGFAFGAWTLERSPEVSTDLVVDAIRSRAVARIRAAQPGEAGAVAAALLVGERDGLSQTTVDDLRVAGLAHLLAISGLHMMLLAGTAFFAARALLALSPTLALSRPIRKWAAVAALLVATVYLALSGGAVATMRAYVMAVVMFTAILVDRPAISMRNLALAAFAVLLVEPESVTEPGFQMSFGAVMALIAAWEIWNGRARVRLDDDPLPGGRLAAWPLRAALAVAFTSLVAGLATAPFAAYHFERIASYSLLGNLLAAPLVSLVIMPFGLLTLVVMPFGIEAAPLAVMAWGIDTLLAIAGWVAHLPGAEMPAPRIAPACLCLIAGGLLWTCLWRRPWRLAGVAAMLAGVALIPVLADPPDILVAPDGKAIAVRDASGTLRVAGSRYGAYVVEQFLDKETAPPETTAALREGVACDEVACVLGGADGLRVSLVTDPLAFAEDCRRADLLVTPLPAPADCAAERMIDADALARGGAHAVRVATTPEGRRYAVNTERNDMPRPWQAGGAGLPAFSIFASGR